MGILDKHLQRYIDNLSLINAVSVTTLIKMETLPATLYCYKGRAEGEVLLITY